MLKQLLFSNPVFHDGINVTVRRGYKWADAMGEIVNVMDTDNVGLTAGGAPAMAQVLGVLVTKLNTIPESILVHEHDPTCRTLHGIAKEMRNVYGDDVKDDEPVTVLFFEFGKSAIFEVEDDDVRVDVEIDFDEQDLLYLAMKAHDRDMTLNQIINEMLTDFIKENQDGTSNN